MTDVFDGSVGATPLDEEDRQGLRPSWIASRSDLNRAEQANVLKAAEWARGRGWKVEDFTQPMLKHVHERMFGDVWRWAGTYRTRMTNLGVDAGNIVGEVENLLRDAAAQYASDLDSDEVAVRFHHRLVSIHPFPNGNGRHARMCADILAQALGREPFTWGGAHIEGAGAARAAYLDALRRADAGDIQPLLTFARG